MLGDGLFLILEAELQLLGRQLFGPTAELMTRQALDQQPKLVVLGIQLAQHLLQRDGIVRQCVRVDLHSAMMNDAAASLPELFAAPGKLSGEFRSAARHRRPPLAAVEQSRQLRRGQHDPAGRVGRRPGELAVLEPLGQHAQPDAVMPDQLDQSGQAHDILHTVYVTQGFIIAGIPCSGRRFKSHHIGAAKI